MKIKPSTWCKIQEKLANLKCPDCFSAKVNLKDCEGENAECQACGCTFDFDPDIADRLVDP